MLTFPQLSTGALTQYPLRKRLTQRTVLNVTEDGHAIALADTGADTVYWDLSFTALTDAEVSALVTFFQSCEGSLQPFIFVDPSANLMIYSEDFSQPVWQRNTLVTLETQIADPFGTNRASRLTNTSAGTLTLTQTIPMPGTLNCAFSLYLRQIQTTTFTLSRTDGSTVRSLDVDPSSVWGRYALSSLFAS